ncbi:MAG TPA: alcohol dehydrogenase catalytic domain-containing protein [Candidatus Dormibacteraeota bacterium]|nr:alcohol dehydrogenase catalytic domain-containing protein [Candidatus Dormibacteraeota bacterium]
MRAMVLRGPRDLGLGEVDTPKPGPGEVLVRLQSSGICGTDLKIYEGAISTRYPLIMGHEMSGEVVEGGDGELRNGERVVVDPALYCGACFHCRAGQTNLCPNGVLLGRDANGSFADYVAVPRSQVFRLPDSVDRTSAPLIQVITVCRHAHRLIGIFPGQSVVVLGLGVTGQVHVQLAKAWGADPVIGITRSAWKRRLSEDLGADITLSSGTACVSGVQEATGGLGADVVIECTGKIPVIADAISMVRPGGTLVLFGISTATEGKLPFYQLYFKELKIVNPRAAKSEDFPASIDLVARGAVKLNPLVSHVLPLAEAREAITMLESGDDQRMKIILEN